ncbi:imidazolonepropionase [Clostridium sp. D2Q-14]|uniref:imidazolonepropionase n=1 Tax=Anaeromonas gelatinilytica TaxID=2683194 RepID=UPI00193C10B5|nr:imidazolonepropionase [Anaeromonas gelatinilytica]MBS4536383.1 imidazolonepropionase [Anaeromonas gelatinilytica]
MKNKLIIKNANEIITCSGFKQKKGKEMSDLHIINDGAIIIEDGIIKKVGKTENVLRNIDENQYKVIDANNKCVLPGFIDPHTHFVFGGYRAEEYGWRLKGLEYMEIMNRGGGIVNSTDATKEATLDELIDMGRKRLDSMISFGVTSVEGKSGYGLDLDTEIKQLKAMKELNETHPLDISTTFLGAHAVPEEYKGRQDEFIDYIIENVLPKVAEKNLAEFCDVFCEENVFSIEQSRKLLKKAKEFGLKIKLHADEIVPLGGAELSAELGAISADHLLQASNRGIKLMVENNVVATLLPGTAFSLKERYARARDIIDSGCAVALATDMNPGSCFTESIPLIIALATLYMDMTTEETINALTINAAAAIDKADMIGSIDEGKKADIVIHEFPSYNYIPYHIAVSTVEKVIKNGNIIYNKDDRGGLLCYKN